MHISSRNILQIKDFRVNDVFTNLDQCLILGLLDGYVDIRCPVDPETVIKQLIHPVQRQLKCRTSANKIRICAEESQVSADVLLSLQPFLVDRYYDDHAIIPSP